ncbi:MAG: molybdate ABC transporter substrate-binding protein [Jatrophihabitantaceae bacterium]
MRRAVIAAAVCTALVAPACSSSAGAKSSAGHLSGSIKVFAASSLKEAFTTLGSQFEAAHQDTKVIFNFDASSALASSITQGQQADVFASASTKNMGTVVSAGDASASTSFVSNTMEIATPAGNPAKVTGIADLAEPGLKVALCDPAVPCGATAQEVFDKAKVGVRAITTEPDVKATLAVVEIKEVDAGMVYVTDVRAAGSKVTGVKIPDDINASTSYPIAALKNSGNPDLAKAWVDYVLSDVGQKVLRGAGFSRP